MTASPEQRERLLGFYRGAARWMRPGVAALVDDADAVLEGARARFEGLIDELPYVDRPTHTMAPSMFACGAMLAVFQVLRERAVDAHAWGRVIHGLPAQAAGGDDDDERFRSDAASSQHEAAPDEFVFDVVEGDDAFDRGMNITSCAICHLFGRHDAMDLVPYMCSFDDVVSAAAGSGLRRTGTIALGAKRCDFRFRRGGEPLPLADQYPDRIQLRPAATRPRPDHGRQT